MALKSQEDDGEPFEAEMKSLTAKLEDQFAESAALEQAIRRNLAMLDFNNKTMT